MASRALLLVALCVACLCVASAVPLGSRESLNGVGRVHGALNRRLSREDALRSSLGDVQPQWHTQQLDHSNLASTATFKQRFFVNDSFYTVASPRVFLMIGGEGPISPAYVSGHFAINGLAEQYGAMIAALEHRFYGESVPNGDSSTENLRFLSSALALEDLVTFREALTQKYHLPPSTTWIVFGGSYSGSLAGWARLKYPNLFHGAFATSAPVQAQLEFSQYFDVVARSLGAQCTASLNESTAAVTTLLASDSGRASLQKMFNLCGPIKSDLDVANFLSTLSGPIAGVVQYNDDNTSYEMYDLTQLCARLAAADTPLQGLQDVWNDYNAFSNNTQCTDIGYDSMIAQMQATSDARSWTYQTCNEFGYFQDAINDGLQPFSPLISLEFYTQQCNDIFKGAAQPFLPKTQFINDYYGGAQIVTDNTVFANGDVDPWHVLSNYQSYAADKLSATVLIHGTAHCADMYPPRAQDVAGLTAARQMQNQLLAQWLAAHENKGAAGVASAGAHHRPAGFPHRRPSLPAVAAAALEAIFPGPEAEAEQVEAAPEQRHHHGRKHGGRRHHKPRPERV